ncbi:hypothetical protein OG863_39630 [Streptomyces decoyicus]|uniref:Uncharacterized protein n=1 Tax=Streptomyces decoyicus TaxID=249567 RepID=A0ABZ1FT07_9ACTN|nr:hypothetical protein [Streptomyces decoyicus]WSB73567.1 hypothetical protein OG863_39630 [Streptomyces decoyicus]
MKDSASRQADDGETRRTPFVVDPVDEKLDEGEREGMGLPHPGYTSPDFSSPGSLPSSSSAEQGGGHDAADSADTADTAGGAGETAGAAGTGGASGTAGSGDTGDTRGESSSAAPDQQAPAGDAADEEAVPGFSAPEFTSPSFDSPDIPTGPQLGETETGRRMRAEQQGEDAVTPVPLPEAHRPPQPPPRQS